MEKIYLDTNILIYIVEQDDELLKEKAKKIVNSKAQRFVISQWNLFEISNSAPEKALKIADFIDKDLQPLWLIETANVRSLEVERFFKKIIYKEKLVALNVFCQYLSQVDYYLLSEPPLVGTTARSIIQAWIMSPNALRSLKNVFTETPKCIETIIRHKKNGSLSTRTKEVFYKILGPFTPQRDPANLPLDEKTKNDFLDYCWKHKAEFYRHCPTFKIDHLLREYRSSDPKRKAKMQDAPDLQHQLVPLAYCNYFITNDRYVENGINYLSKHIKIASCFRSLFDLP